MGWLFAVALGLHRRSRGVVWAAMIPIALGHAAAIVVTLAAVLALGAAMDARALEIAGGALLLGWAGWHAVYGHRQRARVGMTTGMLGLALWSFLMAGAHGAGLMLIPVVLPLCLAASPAGDLVSTGSGATALAAVGVHMLAMLAVIALIATIVYEWAGVGFLRRGWINLDLLWSAALAAAGLAMIL
ncbi:MAG: hypothetical protein AAFR16_03600 [Pseudomonadota bacterium]